MRIITLGGTSYDSNVYLIPEEPVVMIDASTGHNFKLMVEEMKKLGLGPKDISLLINTHCHFDHAGGNHFFSAAGAIIAIHESEAAVLEAGDEIITCAAMFGEKMPPVPVGRKLRVGDVVRAGELELRVIHTPGHTHGSICLYDAERKLLFSGDTVFCGGVGRTDLPTGNEVELLNSLKALAKLEVEALYPGHGPATERGGKKYIEAAVKMLGRGIV